MWRRLITINTTPITKHTIRSYCPGTTGTPPPPKSYPWIGKGNSNNHKEWKLSYYILIWVIHGKVSSWQIHFIKYFRILGNKEYMLWIITHGKHREWHNTLLSITDGSGFRNSIHPHDIKDMDSPDGIFPTHSVQYESGSNHHQEVCQNCDTI